MGTGKPPARGQGTGAEAGPWDAHTWWISSWRTVEAGGAGPGPTCVFLGTASTRVRGGRAQQVPEAHVLTQPWCWPPRAQLMGPAPPTTGPVLPAHVAVHAQKASCADTVWGWGGPGVDIQHQ